MEDFPWDFPAPHGADEDPKLAVEPKKNILGLRLNMVYNP